MIRLKIAVSALNDAILKHVKLFNTKCLIIAWLTVSNQIVKSLSLCYKKSYFFNMVQPIDLIFCKMAEIIKQKFFNRADFLLRS